MKEWLIYVFESKIYVTYVMELLAALAGSIYLHLSSKKEKEYLFFVKFLWSVLFIDIMGGYAGLAYFDNYEHFQFLKGTPFVRNEWYFNIAQVYFICVYTYLLQKKLSLIKLKFILKWSIALYIVFSLINMYLSDDFFENEVTINYIVGAFMILFSVFFYFFDMMISNKVLSFYKDLFFYVAVAIAISFLVRVPISIYTEFITQENPEFIQVFHAVVRYSNIFMYLLFTYGFYMDYRYRKILQLEKT